jgi:hypothetical protein
MLLVFHNVQQRGHEHVGAVGLANGHNPIGIIFPCHRVIGANGSLTGYGGGLERKRVLLELEEAERPDSVEFGAVGHRLVTGSMLVLDGGYTAQ